MGFWSDEIREIESTHSVAFLLASEGQWKTINYSTWSSSPWVVNLLCPGTTNCWQTPLLPRPWITEFPWIMNCSPATLPENKLFTHHSSRPAMRSWPYMFKTEWIPDKDNAIAGELSRVSPMPVNLIKSEIELPIHQVNIIKATMEVEDVRELQWETASDPELQAMAKAISNGWPTLHKQTHPILHDYWNYRDELSINNGILTKNQKIIIPKMLQRKYLDRIHSSHQGIQQSLPKVHEYVFWVNYTKHIKEKTEKCSLCQEN